MALVAAVYIFKKNKKQNCESNYNNVQKLQIKTFFTLPNM